ncbi:hypothetical protein AVL61_02620 [Kocuria rosea subsp. polaris]|uniref:Uncharacterized protein n=1 Tax=Kocuria rosea subsp. polaris TaxID=136273 RepID=A0A0W8IQE7_KOCRO|nr:hypothetical protein AVL61_02620 [Kocuria polaris]
MVMLVVVRDREDLHPGVIAGGPQPLDDVVDTRPVAGGADGAVATVGVRGVLEGPQVALQLLGGDGPGDLLRRGGAVAPCRKGRGGATGGQQ